MLAATYSQASSKSTL